MTAFRLYSSVPSDKFSIELAHGFSSQPKYDLFEGEHLVHRMNGRLHAIPGFLLKSRRWLLENHGRFDFFHGLQGFHPTVLPALWAENLGIPSVVKIAAHKTDLVEKRGIRSLLRLSKRRIQILNRISGVIAISDEIVEELLSYGIDSAKIFHIPNAVRTDIFHPLPQACGRSNAKAALGWDYSAYTILFVGEVVERKRPHLLLRAVKELADIGIPAQLIIAGPFNKDSDYVKGLFSLIQELNIETRVQFLGFISDMAPLYQAADIFSLPSKSEGMANALLEAMASGLPSVVTRFSGTSELIAETGAGLEVAEQPAALAQALKEIYIKPGLYKKMSNKAVRVVADGYSAPAIWEKHENMFQTIKVRSTT